MCGQSTRNLVSLLHVRDRARVGRNGTKYVGQHMAVAMAISFSGAIAHGIRYAHCRWGHRGCCGNTPGNTKDHDTSNRAIKCTSSSTLRALYCADVEDLFGPAPSFLYGDPAHKVAVHASSIPAPGHGRVFGSGGLVGGLLRQVGKCEWLGWPSFYRVTIGEKKAKHGTPSIIGHHQH